MSRLEDEMTLPFEELDPCCQREILQERHKSKVTKQLRKGDRSNERWDLHNRALSSMRGGARTAWGHCACCEESTDYPLLAKLRSKVAEIKARTDNGSSSDWRYNASSVNSIQRGSREDDEDDDDDDDDDEFGDLLADAPLTPSQQAQMDALAAAVQATAMAKAFGMAQHTNDSLAHVSQLLSPAPYSSLPPPPLVLHVYDASEEDCAWVDLALEGLASKFIGTRFRRVKRGENKAEAAELSAFKVRTTLHTSHFTLHTHMC